MSTKEEDVADSGDRSARRLAEAIRNLLERHGRLRARRIASLLRDDGIAPGVSRRDVNSVLYQRKDLFARVAESWWRGPQWEAIVIIRRGSGEPQTTPDIEQIEPIQEEAVQPLETGPSVDKLALQKRREALKRSAKQAPASSKAKEGVHAAHPTHPLPDSYHTWAKGEITPYSDQDTG